VWVSIEEWINAQKRWQIAIEQGAMRCGEVQETGLCLQKVLRERQLVLSLFWR